ncbi:MAG: SDR family oxidoreductase [Pseudomonadota bacterium]
MARNTVLVTGVSRGIGRAIADRLAAGGYQVVGISRTLPEDYAGIHRCIDLSQATAKAQLADVVAEFAPGRLVANAGISSGAGLLDVNDGDLEDVWRVNLQSVVWSMQAVVPTMQADKFGRIVVIGSRAALGKAERTAYAASKAALGGVVRTTALEFGRDGITINIVAPGPIDTEMFAKHQPEGSPARQAIVDTTAVGRIGRPDEVAKATRYFLSDDAGFTTGQTLYVCGGMTVGAVQ